MWEKDLNSNAGHFQVAFLLRLMIKKEIAAPWDFEGINFQVFLARDECSLICASHYTSPIWYIKHIDFFASLMLSYAFSYKRSQCIHLVSAVDNSTIKRIVLPETYLKEVRPPTAKGNPVVIEFSVFVVDINSINVEDMDFRVDMFVHQKWKESRLTLSDDLFEDGDDYVTLPPEFFDNLWQPDPYFLNSKVAGKNRND